ncbi:MAG: FKBP-type peptidyl-prolyl cis-trans isomerase [Planctomycetota bacterium]
MNFRILLVCLLLLSSSTLIGQTVPPQPKPAGSPKIRQAQPAAAEQEMTQEDEGSTIQKASFLIGFNTITRLKQQEAEFDFEQLLAGLNAAQAGKESGMTREEQRSVLMAYQNMIRARIRAKRQATADKNGKEGETALAEFAKQEGAKELEEGVMYVVVKEGDGEIPEAPDRVKLHYKGTYIDGEEFDSSLDGEPLENGVMQFVPGFSKALMSMKVGSKWKVIIRGDKAYGMRPRPPMEVNKTLMFEIELLEILPIE